MTVELEENLSRTSMKDLKDRLLFCKQLPLRSEVVVRQVSHFQQEPIRYLEIGQDLIVIGEPQGHRL